MSFFYHRETSGHGKTNLQLFSLVQAIKYWGAAEIEFRKGHRDKAALLEYYVFVIACLGLSLSQLLGQNYSKEASSLPELHVLLSDIFQRIPAIDKNQKKRVINEFGKLIALYNQCRHFGITRGGKTHSEVAAISHDQVARYVSLTYEIWNLILNLYRTDPQNELSELENAKIEEIVKELIESNELSFMFPYT